jgi:hypothetical protein
MSRWLRAVWNNTDKITKWAQVIALGVAAYWTYTRFLTGEAPSLEPRLAVDASYDTSRGPIKGTCHVQARITVSNAGKTSFDVEKVHLQVFRSALPKATAAIKTPLDEHTFEQGDPFEIDLALPLLLQHYAPGQQSDQTVSWIIEKHPSQVYLFKIKVDASDNYGHRPSATARHWEWGICAGEIR